MVFMASALEQVVLECASRAGVETFDRLRSQAIDLLYYWPAEATSEAAALPLLPKAEAMAAGPDEREGLRLGRLVLAGRSQLSHSQTGSLAWFQTAIDMPRLWELLVIQSLRSSGCNSVIDGNSSPENRRISAPSPWSQLSSTSRRPDIAFRVGGDWHLADAKYKRLKGGTPDAADVNQMYMYSQLATIDGAKPGQVDLFYPARLSAPVIGPFHAAEPKTPPLTLHEVPFPQPMQIR